MVRTAQPSANGHATNGVGKVPAPGESPASNGLWDSGGHGPREESEFVVLAALIHSESPRGLSERLFSSEQARIIFRLVCEFHDLEGNAPGATLWPILLKEELPKVHRLYRDAVQEASKEILKQIDHPVRPACLIGYELFVKRLREVEKRERVLSTLRLFQQRVEHGHDIATLEADIRSTDWSSDATESDGAPRLFSDLLSEFTSLREPVIDGIGRRGEVANVIFQTKGGKTWLLQGQALCVASGRDWLGHRIARPRNALIIDNELHPETLTWRIKTVAEAMGLEPDEYASRLRVKSVRGQSVDVNHLRRMADQCRNWSPDWIGLDSFYRFVPAGYDENSNSQMKDMAERIIAFADDLNAMVIVAGHSTKGSQAEKSITDVGSGAGSISRAADSHLILRSHREDDCAVFDGCLRSFAPIEPRVLRWSFPLWTVDADLNPNELRCARQQKADEENLKLVSELVESVNGLAAEGKAATNNALRTATGWGKQKVDRILRLCLQDCQLFKNTEDEQTYFTTFMRAPNGN